MSMGALLLTCGAWRTGDKSEFRDMAEYISARGLAVANVTYRLSTDAATARHPDHISDVYAALAHLVNNADELGIVPRITLVGHSVGAWMVLGALTRHNGMPELNENIASSVVAAVLVVSACLPGWYL